MVAARRHHTPPPLGGLAGGALLRYVVPLARGSGIPQVKAAYAVRGGRLSFFNSTVGKFAVGVLQIGSVYAASV